MISKKKKVVVAMSGGVDSSVAAALLVKQGYDVIGVFMQFWFPKGVIYGENRCCSLESFNHAKEVADSLGIKIHKLNFGNEFKKKIVDQFLDEYNSGKTPNPCIACNKFIKFNLLLKKSLTVFDADYLATGHYVKVKGEKLLRGNDKNKDQSYFLYNLKKEDLDKVLFPVGKYNKPKIRKLAKKLNLPVFDKKDSQEICFVGNSHYDFLKKFLKLKPGKIVDENKKELGEHEGLPLYTLGQRSGIKLPGGPWYVAGFNRKNNELIVTKDQKKSDIYNKSLVCKDISWVVDKPKLPLRCKAQIRYRGKANSCKLSQKGNQILVEFGSPQRAIMPGQSVVFYKGKQVLGGGIIK